MKFYVFLASVFAVIILLFIRSVDSNQICNLNFNCLHWLAIIHNLLIFSPFILFFSLLTYKMPAVVTTKWLNFAKWSVPVILLIILLINMQWHHHRGGWMNMDADFDRLYVMVLYMFFVAGSLIQIFRGYRQLKSN